MEKLYRIQLTPEQRKALRKIVRIGRNKAKVITHAHILLKSDEGKTDKEITELFYIAEETVRRVRQRFCQDGLELALHGKPYPKGDPSLSDEQEAYLIALACSDPPAGRSRWTLELLSERMMADKVVE